MKTKFEELWENFHLNLLTYALKNLMKVKSMECKLKTENTSIVICHFP